MPHQFPSGSSLPGTPPHAHEGSQVPESNDESLSMPIDSAARASASPESNHQPKSILGQACHFQDETMRMMMHHHQMPIRHPRVMMTNQRVHHPPRAFVDRQSQPLLHAPAPIRAPTLEELLTSPGHLKNLDANYYTANESSCPICHNTTLDSDSDNRVVKTKLCKHIFHRECLVTWVSTQVKTDQDSGTCPLCRQVLCCGTMTNIDTHDRLATSEFVVAWLFSTSSLCLVSVHMPLPIVAQYVLIVLGLLDCIIALALAIFLARGSNGNDPGGISQV